MTGTTKITGAQFATIARYVWDQEHTSESIRPFPGRSLLKLVMHPQTHHDSVKVEFHTTGYGFTLVQIASNGDVIAGPTQ